jgi:hypothetical protein
MRLAGRVLGCKGEVRCVDSGVRALSFRAAWVRDTCDALRSVCPCLDMSWQVVPIGIRGRRIGPVFQVQGRNFSARG